MSCVMGTSSSFGANGSGSYGLQMDRPQSAAFWFAVANQAFGSCGSVAAVLRWTHVQEPPRAGRGPEAREPHDGVSTKTSHAWLRRIAHSPGELRSR